MSDTSRLTLRIYDGTRALFSAPANFLVTITDGNRTQHIREFYHRNQLTFDLPFFDNFGDGYSIVVWAEGYRQAGFAPVQLLKNAPTTLDLMLVAEDPGFSFVNARWPAAWDAYPFLGADLADPAAAQARYENFLDQHESALACMLNLCEAMSQIHLVPGSPLDLIKALRWDDPAYFPANDRFFAWCDPALAQKVKTRANAGAFTEEKNPGAFHPGATRSWKQIQFGEADVQLTFHENDHRKVGDVDCVLLEPDIDYYSDLAAHALCEVIPHGLTNSVTDPVDVYVLRWIAGRRVNAPEFAPLYTIV